MPGEVRVGHRQKFPLGNSGDALARAARGGGGVPGAFLEVLKNGGDVALRDALVGLEGWLDCRAFGRFSRAIGLLVVLFSWENSKQT